MYSYNDETISRQASTGIGSLTFGGFLRRTYFSQILDVT